jgi:hypothetical protein
MHKISIRRKFYSHNLVSLQTKRSDFFSLDKSKIVLSKKFDGKMLFVIDFSLDIFSNLSLVKIVVGLFEDHAQRKNKYLRIIDNLWRNATFAFKNLITLPNEGKFPYLSIAKLRINAILQKMINKN